MVRSQRSGLSRFSRSAALARALLASLAMAGCPADEAAVSPNLDARVPADVAVEGGSTVHGDGSFARTDGSIVVAGMDAAGLDASGNEPVAGPAVPGETGRLAGITAAHNAARARVLTMPALPPLTWSPEVAAIAQAYANSLAAGCADGLLHSNSQARHGYGENLGSFEITGGNGNSPTGTAAGVVALWESEDKCYRYGPFQPGVNATCSAGCEAYGGCGHYTQLIWRTTQRVGCGVADCQRDRTRKSYWVCNYDPTGNYVDEKPY